MENKATISYSFAENGDENNFLTLSTKLAEIIPNHTVEWRRTYGGSSHLLSLKIKVLPLTFALLDRKDLVTRPYCHIYWTDCNDIDLYKSTVKNEIASWLNMLKARKDMDWIIVVITEDVISRLTKAKLQLPRMSITDKIKADFCSKKPDRLHILQEPNRDSTKSVESWAQLGLKVATMTVQCMETVVSKYEDEVRAERERRNEKSWDFCNYFLLQEELAFMYEMLSMFGSALVQYDELDAMFTQYVLNANAGDVAHWLVKFSKPVNQWHSLLLWKQMDSDARLKISQGQASVIDVRNYIFNRLCHLLFQMGKVAEVTQRMHSFLHTISTEVEVLEIKIAPGAVQCWVFMCCLELVDALKRIGKSLDDVSYDMTSDKLLLQNASLWNLARLKLSSLAKLCGLMPGVKTTSAHLQVVVDLLAGMGEGEERGDSSIPPPQILREALSSKTNFQKHYFELSELAMGTFKHMGHYRAARSIGRDLAEFYLLCDEPAHAEGYLVDVVRMFAEDGWRLLHSDATLSLAKCYKQTLNIKRYLRLCYSLMCNKTLSHQQKCFYCDEFQSTSGQLDSRVLSVNLWPLATVTLIRFIPVETNFRVGSKQHIEVVVDSHAPKSMSFDSAAISLETIPCEACSSSRFTASDICAHDVTSIDGRKSALSTSSDNDPRSQGRHRHVSSSTIKDLMTNQTTTTDSEGRIKVLNLSAFDNFSSRSGKSELLPLREQKEVQQDNQVAWSGIICKRSSDLLRRQDSNPSQRTKHSAVALVSMDTFECCLATSKVVLHPGMNVIRFVVDTSKEGTFQMQQLRFAINSSYFVLPRLYPIISYKVAKQKPDLIIDQAAPLTRGVLQSFSLLLRLNDYDTITSDDVTAPAVTLKYPSDLELFEEVKYRLVSPQGDEDEMETFLHINVAKDSNTAHLPLPSASSHSLFIFYLSCFTSIEDTSIHLEHKQRHRRTHSAPPATFPYSPKLLPRQQIISESSSAGDCDVTIEVVEESDNFVSESENGFSRSKKGVVSFNNKLIFDNNKIKQSIKKSFKLFQSKSPSSSSLPDKVIDGDVTSTVTHMDSDLIEVELNDVTDGDVTPVSFYLNKINNSGDALNSQFDESSEEETMEIFDQQVECPSHFSHDTSFNLSIPVIDLDDQPCAASLATSYHQITLAMSWEDVPDVTLSLSFIHPLEFTHAWDYAYPGHRFLHIAVENVSSLSLTLEAAKLRLTNTSQTEVTYMGTQKQLLLKAKGSCAFVWKIGHSVLDRLSAQFDVSVRSNSDNLSNATYKFEVENIEPIYEVTCSVESNEPLQSGQMTELHITVARLRMDKEHEVTASGQHMLMFQVVDNRGRWAVCGKSSGVVSVKARSRGEVAKATVEVMPLVSGHLHLPYVLLHRFMKRRSSEFDERLSSTDSPVMKPPQLKAFEKGEVYYKQQAHQVYVVSDEDLENERRVTKL